MRKMHGNILISIGKRNQKGQARIYQTDRQLEGSLYGDTKK